MKLMFVKRLLLPMAITFIFTIARGQDKVALFLPQDKSGWYTYTGKSGKNNDTNKVFTFEGNVLHVSGEEFGYVITEKKYGDFHLTFEFKWGEKKYPPRENAKRDGGILYHADLYSGDKIWPRSLEYQVQEGDCGDFWMTDSTTIIYKGMLTKPSSGAFQAVKSVNAEKPNGEWNKGEIIVKGGNITHLLNGREVNKGSLGNTVSGNIILQSEGAELYYRNVVITEL